MERIEQESKEYVVQPNEVESPKEQQRLFKTLDALLDYTKFARPVQFSARSGVYEGNTVWELVYIHSNGGE